MNETKNKDEGVLLTAQEAEIYTDMIVGIKIADTAARLRVSVATVNRRRDRIKKFMRKKFDFTEFQRKVFALVPLTIQSIAYHLLNKDKEVTLKVAQGLGLLAKDNEELKEILLALTAANSSTPQPVVNNITNQFYDGLGKDDQRKFDNNLAAVFQSGSTPDRFRNN